MRNLFAGAISLWFGSIVGIPKGYALCNGENGTPDLQNSFVVNAGDTYAVDDVGGNINHNHDFTGDGHQHNLAPAISLAGGTDLLEITTDIPATGTTDNANGLPPYKSLAYIMEI